MKRRKGFIQCVFIVVVICGILFSFKVANQEECKHRKVPYTSPDYSEYKKGYATFFDGVASNRFNKCFCGNMPPSFNAKIKYDEHLYITVEPLFVNLQNCNGIYSQKFHSKYSVYSNHKIPHYLFVIKNKEFIELRNLDSIQIKNILTNSDIFTKIYTKYELDSIYDIIKYGTIWADALELAPYYVTDNGKKIYDAFNEK